MYWSYSKSVFCGMPSLASLCACYQLQSGGSISQSISHTAFPRDPATVPIEREWGGIPRADPSKVPTLELMCALTWVLL